MSLPYFPMFPTDFEAKTSHLTLAEDGAYNRLLRLMWMTPGCSLPDDDAWIMRRMRCTKEEFEAVVLVVIDEFCDRENGRVSNAKLTSVFQQSSEAHEKRVLAGSKGGKSKSLKTNKTASSNAQAKPKQPEPEPEPKGVKPPNPLAVLTGILSHETAADFIAHRKAMKKPVTPAAAKRIVSKLKDHPDPNAVVDESIANGWQGVFPERTKHAQRKESATDFARRAGERFAARYMDSGPGEDHADPLLHAGNLVRIGGRRD